MSEQPRIVIEPKLYRGWELKHQPSHDGKSDCQASQEGRWVAAATLPELLKKIGESERVTVRFTRPMRCLYRDRYGRGHYQKAEVFALDNGNFYFHCGGETHHARLEELDEQIGREREREQGFVLDTPENRRRLLRAGKLEGQARALKSKAEELRKALDPLLGVFVKHHGAQYGVLVPRLGTETE